LKLNYTFKYIFGSENQRRENELQSFPNFAVAPIQIPWDSKNSNLLYSTPFQYQYDRNIHCL